ncbi:MAG: hypothetical protein U1F67_03655 [Rubrivivax sp.]
MGVQRFHRLVAAGRLAAASLGFNAAQATVFSDNFEGTLSQWSAIGSGVIVADPLNGANALSFRQSGSGGDIRRPSPGRRAPTA